MALDVEGVQSSARYRLTIAYEHTDNVRLDMNRQAQPLAKLNLIACHISLLVACDLANDLKVLRQTRSQSVEEQG
jgi:hypothetical protein